MQEYFLNLFKDNVINLSLLLIAIVSFFVVKYKREKAERARSKHKSNELE